MLRWNLYWVESTPDENCFVVAKTRRSAEKHDEEIADVEPHGCTATLVKVISPSVLETWKKAEKRIAERTFDFFSATQGRQGYADDRLLKILGAEFKFQDGARVTILDGHKYRTAGFEKTYLGKSFLITSCESLIARVKNLTPEIGFIEVIASQVGT